MKLFNSLIGKLIKFLVERVKEFTLPKIEVFSIIHILLIDTLKKNVFRTVY